MNAVCPEKMSSFLSTMALGPSISVGADGRYLRQTPYLTDHDYYGKPDGLYEHLLAMKSIRGVRDVPIIFDNLPNKWLPFLERNADEAVIYMDEVNSRGAKGSALDPSWSAGQRLQLLALFVEKVAPAFAALLAGTLIPKASPTDARVTQHVIYRVYFYIASLLIQLPNRIEAEFAKRFEGSTDLVRQVTQKYEMGMYAKITDSDIIFVANLDYHALFVLYSLAKRVVGGQQPKAKAKKARLNDGEAHAELPASQPAVTATAAAAAAASAVANGGTNTTPPGPHRDLNAAWKASRDANEGYTREHFKTLPQGLAAIASDTRRVTAEKAKIARAAATAAAAAASSGSQ